MTVRFSTEKAERQVRPQLLLALLIWVGILLLLRSPQQSVLAHDEGYYAQQARWILVNQDWLTVGWWGTPIYDRTIGLQWLIALSYKAFGISEWAVRLPSTLTALGAGLLTWRLGLRMAGGVVGLGAAAILAVMPVWAQASRLGTQDITLVFLELLGLWALLKAEESKHFWGWGMLAGTTVGLAFLVKSVMIVLPVIALMPYLIQRRRMHLLNPGLYAGLALGLGPAAIWLGLSIQTYGWLPLEELFGKLLLLADAETTGTAYHRATTPLFYLWNIPANTFPWCLLAIAGGILVFRKPSITRKWLWLGYPLILLGQLLLFDTRTWYYPLQLYPFLAMWAALALVRLAQRYVSTRPSERRLPVRLSWILGILGGLLIVTGVGILAAPLWGLDPALRPYGGVGLAGGLGWLLPGWVMLQDRDRRWQRRGWLWQLGWLLGPWLAIATVFLTGLWGNYAPDVKTLLQTPPVAEIAQTQPIDFVRPNASRSGVLLTFYTPELGAQLNDWSEIPPSGYAWGPLGVVPSDYRVIATVRDWQLVQAPAP